MKIQKNILFLFLFISINTFAQEYQNIWQTEIDAFDKLDGNNPLQDGILFTGSSSIRMWKDPAKDFNNPKILNRGFGGSQIIDLIENFDRVILKYHPNKIVIYSGDNDVI